MHQKTIMVVLNTSWNIYNFRLGLIKALQREGYAMIAVAPYDHYSVKLEEEGIEYHNIKINNKGTNPFEEIKLTYDLYKLYKKHLPDIILEYTIKANIYGSFAAKVLGIPVISNISGLGTVFLNDSLSSKIARKLYKVALKIPETVFFQNSIDRALFIDEGLVRTEKSALLPGSGIDVKKFKPLNLFIQKNHRFQFLLIARLIKDKGIVEYVDAARILKLKYPEVEFAIVGAYYPGNPTSISRDTMHQWKHEGAIKYIGVSEDIKLVIAGADCIVLPSYREGLSRVLLEAASMEKPIVTTDVPGCREVVNHGKNGYLCKVKDAKDLAKQMEKMLQLTEDKRIIMGRNSRKKVISEFDEKIVIHKYTEAIKRILELKGR